MDSGQDNTIPSIEPLPEVIVGESYRLKMLIGEGGMGNVYRAEHIVIGREYALKMLAPDKITQDNWNRFQAEGKAIARLDHPHIVKIYNMGLDKTGFPYYVMDLLEGKSLQDALREKPALQFEDLISIFIQIANALSYAHSKGIIHRDIKPSNIMLLDKPLGRSSEPNAMLVDFGIAKLVTLDAREAQKLTSTGQIYGTPLYMSPEQAIGSQIDARSDIYSFGCALFEALTGKPPFKGPSATETVLMHLNEQPPTLLAASGIEYGEDLEALIAKLLQKDRDHRYQSMAQVELDLRRILQNKPVATTKTSLGFKTSGPENIEYEPEKKLARKRVVILTSLALLIAGGFTALFMNSINSIVTTSSVPQTPANKEETNISNKSEYEEFSEKAPLSDREKKVLRYQEEFMASGQTIDSESKGKDRIFHFPEKFSLGTLCYPSNLLLLDAPNERQLRVTARGNLTMPAANPPLLLIDATKDRTIFTAPAVLKQIGKNEFKGLQLGTVSDLGVPVSGEDPAAMMESTGEALSCAAEWPQLNYVELHGLLPNEKALLALEKMPALTQLVLTCKDFSAKNLIKGNLLTRLEHIKLDRLTDIDDALLVLQKSNKLHNVCLHNCAFSNQALMGLSNAPNIFFLEFKGIRLNSERVAIVRRIKNLKGLTYAKCPGMNDSLLPVLRQLPPNIVITIQGIESGSEKIKSWAKERQNVCIIGHELDDTGKEAFEQ